MSCICMKHKTHPNRRSILSLALALGAMILPLAADEKEKAIEVPDDFTLSITTSDVGVVPATKQFVNIASNEKADGKRGFSIAWGEIVQPAVKGEAADCAALRDLSDWEALEIYNLVLKIGLFQMKDRYAPEDIEFGGSTSAVTVTANGKTKEIFIASGAEVPEIEKLITAVRRYQLKVARK